ncbi:MAG: hypothetical protein AAGA84_03095 [Pseudomonadota bacterium]
MQPVHSILVYSHIAIGMIAVIAFWIPLATRKGSRWHKRSGAVYVWSMYAVSLTAFITCVMTLVDPIGVRAPARNLDPATAYAAAEQSRLFALFLLMLSILVFASLRHGLMVLRTRQQPTILANRLHRATIITMGIISIAVGILGLQHMRWLLIIFAVLGLSGSVGMWRDTRITQWRRHERLIAHFNGLIGTGIGAYTAVFAFGGSRILAQLLPGQWQVIPWILPTIIGTIAIAKLKQHYTPGTNKGRQHENVKQHYPKPAHGLTAHDEHRMAAR